MAAVLNSGPAGQSHTLPTAHESTLTSPLLSGAWVKGTFCRQTFPCLLHGPCAQLPHVSPGIHHKALVRGHNPRRVTTGVVGAGTTNDVVSHALRTLVANGGAYRTLAAELLAAGIDDDALLECVRESMLRWVDGSDDPDTTNVGDGADGAGAVVGEGGRQGAGRDGDDTEGGEGARSPGAAAERASGDGAAKKNKKRGGAAPKGKAAGNRTGGLAVSAPPSGTRAGPAPAHKARAPPRPAPTPTLRACRLTASSGAGRVQVVNVFVDAFVKQRKKGGPRAGAAVAVAAAVAAAESPRRAGGAALARAVLARAARGGFSRLPWQGLTRALRACGAPPGALSECADAAAAAAALLELGQLHGAAALVAACGLWGRWSADALVTRCVAAGDLAAAEQVCELWAQVCELAAAEQHEQPPAAGLEGAGGGGAAALRERVVRAMLEGGRFREAQRLARAWGLRALARGAAHAARLASIDAARPRPWSHSRPDLGAILAPTLEPFSPPPAAPPSPRRPRAAPAPRAARRARRLTAEMRRRRRGDGRRWTRGRRRWRYSWRG